MDQIWSFIHELYEIAIDENHWWILGIQEIYLK
jgi:hypothetical protein